MHRLRSLLGDLLTRSAVLSGLYHVLVTRAFDSEHMATLTGLRMYYHAVRRGAASRFFLRQNIHRLEKGLSLRGTRLWGTEYVEQTVRCYLELARNAQAGDEELAWARDVLQAYFSLVGGSGHPNIARALAAFQRSSPISAGGGVRVPRQEHYDTVAPVAFERLVALAKRRKAVRRYLPLPVPRELLDRAVWLASLAPSACNRQPFEFRIIDDPNLVRRVASLLRGACGFAEQIPVLVLVLGRLSAFGGAEDRHLVYIDSALAAMLFMLGLETLGLSSCPLNWPDDAKMRASLARLVPVAPDAVPVLALAVGFRDPEGLLCHSARAALPYLRRYNLE